MPRVQSASSRSVTSSSRLMNGPINGPSRKPNSTRSSAAGGGPIRSPPEVIRSVTASAPFALSESALRRSSFISSCACVTSETRNASSSSAES
eukprot:5608229-Prymnesium_polylepis.1